MKSLAIRNGDLAIGPGGFEMLEGSAKVKQDLAIAVREPRGSDRFHPGWGSVLAEYVGKPVSEHTRLLIESEVNRLVGNYATLQQELLQRDAAAGRRPRFGTNEIVTNVRNIQVTQRYDRFHVKVVVSTLSGREVTLTRTVED